MDQLPKERLVELRDDAPDVGVFGEVFYPLNDLSYKSIAGFRARLVHRTRLGYVRDPEVLTVPD